MPVRNAARTLGAALDSISQQTFTDWELVIVDDGSTDQSSEIIATAARRDGRIRSINQEPIGIAEALQRGCAAAHAPIFARMDADDVMHPERLTRQIQFLDQNPGLGLVSCLVTHGGDGSAQAGYALHVKWINSLLTPELMFLRRFVESPIAHPSVMFRRELIEEHGGYRAGDFPEDYELWLRWLHAGVRFGKINAELLAWNDTVARLSRVDARYSVAAFYNLKCRYLALWLRQTVANQRPIWLWGAGRITRKRFAALEENGVRIHGFIDVDSAKLGRLRDGRPVIPPEEIPANAFVLAGVGTRGARELIATRLHSSGRVEGVDFLLAA